MRYLFLLQAGVLCAFLSSFVAAQDNCSSTNPCAQGCCSSEGSCGFGSAYCGKGCQGTCDAQSECGQNAPAGDLLCPLSVCCSYHGYCGTTETFCTKKGDTPCQSGCDAVRRPSCSVDSKAAKGVSIGYYESWSYNRACDSLAPEQIHGSAWTHLNYAFALIDTGTFQISHMNDFDTQLYTRFTGLKANFPGLKTYISVGGWSAGGKVFSDMVSTSANRKAFISSALKFVKTYAFDGIDIDWEYPAAEDRGGAAADTANFVHFMKELRSAFGTLGVTATLPSSYWYLQGFDVKNLQDNLDWFNVMTYDIHGTFSSKTVAPHTNLTEIEAALDLLWRNDVEPSKVVLGLGFYGRSFTLQDASCSAPGCAFTGGAKAGECTGQSGILSNDEIQRIIKAKNISPTLDTKAAVNYLTWDSNQWVSYDNAETLKMKMDYAHSLCLAGTMAWAIDLDTTGESAFNLQGGKLDDTTTTSAKFVEKRTAMNMQNNAQASVFWTRCLNDRDPDRHCPPGFHEIVTGHGKVFDAEHADLAPGCHGNQNRVLCMNNLIIENKCSWNRNSNGGKNCDSRCPSGTYFLSQNTQPAGDKTDCDHGKFISICCESFTLAANTCLPTSFGALFSAGNAGSSPLAIDATISKRGIEDALSYELTKSTVDSSETQAEVGTSKDHGKKTKRYGFGGGCNNFYYPLNTGPNIIPVGSGALGDAIYDPQGSFSGGPEWSGAPGQLIVQSVPPFHTTVYQTQPRLCDGSIYPQACHHYSSVASRNPVHSTIRCDAAVWDIFGPTGYGRDRYPKEWNDQHNSVWSKSWLPKSYIPATGGAAKRANCQRDEWPPFDLWRDRTARGLVPATGHDVYIRLIPGSENGGVVNRGRQLSFQNYCDPPALIPSSVTTSTSRWVVPPFTYQFEQPRTTSTIKALVMTYTNMPIDASDPAYLTHNPCWPHTMSYRLNDPGFALLTHDAYYARTAYNIDPYIYKKAPDPFFTQDLIPPKRRDLSQAPDFDQEDGVIVVREINSTRLPTPEEMRKYLGYTKCNSEDCHEEIAEVRSQFDNFQSEVIAQTSIPRAVPSPVVVTASSDAHAAQPTTLLASARSQPGSGHNTQPLETTAATRRGKS